MRLFRAAIVAIVVGAVASGAAAQPAPDALLRRVAEARDDVPHEGTTVTRLIGPDGHEVVFRREIYAGRRGQSVTRHVGDERFEGHTVIDDGTRRWRVLHDGLLVFVSRPYDFERLRTERVRFASRKAHDWSITLGAEGEVAGRPIWSVRIHRWAFDRWVLVRSLEIDKESALEIGNVAYDHKGREVSVTRYEWIRYLSDDEVDESRFRFEPQLETLVVPEADRVGPPMPFREAKKAAPWLVPLRTRPRDWRPGGVALPQYGRVVVVQFLYAEERPNERPRPVFLFERPIHVWAEHFDEYFDLRQVGPTPVIRGRAVVWTDGRIVYVLTGALPVESLLEVARAQVQ